MNIAWRVLLGLGGLLMLIAVNMDTTVSTGGGRVYNLGLQAQQQMLLILGGVLFIAGVVLFGVVRLKQSPEEERREQEQKRAALKEAGAVVQGGIEKSGLAAANFIVGLKPGTDWWGARLAAGIFSACALSLAGGLAFESNGLAMLLFVGALAVGFWRIQAATALRRLSAAHLGLSLLFFGIFFAKSSVNPERMSTFYWTVAVAALLPSLMAVLLAALAKRRSFGKTSEHMTNTV